MSLAALGYLCLAIDLARRSREEGQKSQLVEIDSGVGDLGDAIASLGVARQGGLAPGGRISAAEMRRLSPIFRGPAKGRLIKNVNDLQGRIVRIKSLVRKGSLDPAVRKTAIAVLSRRCSGKVGGWCIAEKDWEAEAKALFHFVRANVRYMRDPRIADTYVHPARTLFDIRPGSGGAGDCDDAMITLGALLGAAGHGVIARVGAVKSSGDSRPGFNHIWTVSVLPAGGAVGGGGGKLLPLDASVDKPAGWEAPKSRLFRVRDFKII